MTASQSYDMRESETERDRDRQRLCSYALFSVHCLLTIIEGWVENEVVITVPACLLSQTFWYLYVT